MKSVVNLATGIDTAGNAMILGAVQHAVNSTEGAHKRIGLYGIWKIHAGHTHGKTQPKGYCHILGRGGHV
jgi:uncharacterized cupin superfamily protein